MAAESLDLCTYADEERFFSYRRTTHRNEPDYEADFGNLHAGGMTWLCILTRTSSPDDWNG